MKDVRKWVVKERRFDDLTVQLLFNRGIKSKEQIEKFFSPKVEDYQKELNIAHISKTCARISKAIEKQELIVIFGDYDVDGICASAILYKAFTSLGGKALPYIPHRAKEGYGLSNLGLEFARDSGASVVITVDNGIVALEQAKYAKELGLDLIITDHHIPLETLPDAYSIVHSTIMCGAGVAWCLIQEMVKNELREELLQFVAIATICDMIPLIGLGRAFVKEGIKELNRSKNLGLRYLAGECGISLEATGEYEIGHIVGPKLNAIGRLEHAIDALRLLCTKDPTKAKNLAKLLCETNIRRQELTDKAIAEARIQISKIGTKKVHVLDSKDWSPGIIGLVAARVTEEFYRPAIAISVGEVHAKGSARSIEGINIVEIIRECSDLLIDVGGHKGAAGFSILNGNIERFKKRIEKIIKNLPETSEKVLEIEAEVKSKDLTKSFAREIEKFAPFGLLNPKPLLMTREMEITDIRILSGGKHLKGKADGIDFIAFGMGERKELALDSYYADRRNYRKLLKLKVNIAYCLEINRFNGLESLQLKVKDIQL